MAGVYIHGSVGSGKSAVMDMFYAHAKEQRVVPLMRRVHFNAAMLEVNPKAVHSTWLPRCRMETRCMPATWMQHYQLRHPAAAASVFGAENLISTLGARL